LIAIDGISVSFGGVRALDRVSAVFHDPVVGIIGPNGAGKTTLLNVFSGFVEPQEGAIHAFGTDLLAMAPYKRARWGLRRSFQTEQIVDDLSVADNVRVVLDCLPVERRGGDRQVDKALQFAGLAKRASDLPAHLSGFDRRMLEIAKTVVGSPRLVLLDEPGAGLRREEADRVAAVIRDVHDRFGAMTLLIDHDVSLIAATCASALVLDFGERIAFGPTSEVLKDERVKTAYLGVEQIA
jgi:branched-chain amino acid transport system ATP-binding protein